MSVSFTPDTSLLEHGTRGGYTQGCRCLKCRAANAQYIADYRQHKRANKVLLGATIASEAARRLLEHLHREHLTKTAVARALGLRSPGLKVHARITVRRHLLIKRLHRMYMSEAHD
jgi:hypothetical protein